MIKNNSLSISYNQLNLSLIISAFIGVSISYKDFYIFHFFLLILSFFWFHQFRKNEYTLKIDFLSKNHILTLIIFLFWYAVSLLWAPSLELAIKYIFYIFTGLIIVLSIVTYSDKIYKLNKLISILSTFVIIEILIAILESFTDFRMPISAYSSLSPFFGKELPEFSIFDTVLLSSRITPPTGFRWNTNDLAMCMIIVLPFFLCNKKILIKLFGIISITTIVAVTASRAVFLALILVYILYLFLIKKRIGTLLLVWIVSFSIAIGINQFKESDNLRLNEIANSIDALGLYISGDIDIGGSIEWRRELIKNGMNAFYETKGFGLGAGGSVANQEIIGPVAGRFTSMHNFWVELLVEGGVLITLLLFFWLLSIIYKLFIISRKSANSEIIFYSESLLLSVIAFIPAAIAGSSTIYFFPMWIMFGLAIAVIAISKEIDIRL